MPGTSGLVLLHHETRLGQVGKHPGAREEVRLSCVLRTGTLGKDCADGKVEEDGLEVTVREQQGWRVKHENGEGEMEINDMRMQQTFFMTLSLDLEPCMCVHMHEKCEVCTVCAMRLMHALCAEK